MLKETKIYLKEVAKEIGGLKNQRPLKNRGEKSLFRIVLEIDKLKYKFRSFHIASSELRGKTRDQIEKTSESNKVNEEYILKIKEGILKKYELQKEKALRDCA